MNAGKFDPIEVPGPLALLGSKPAAALIRVVNGWIVWQYDPTNRIFTPRILVERDLAYALHAVLAVLLDKDDVRAELREALAVIEKSFTDDNGV